MNKHFIKINSDNFVTHSFTDGFEIYSKDDIYVGDGDRCWSLTIKDMNNMYNYKYENGKIVEISEKDKKINPDYILNLKLNLILKCDNVSNSNVCAAYPLYKQINLSNDSTRSVSVIATEMSKTTQEVYSEMFSLVQNLNSVEELKSYKSTIDTTDFTSLVSSAPESNRHGLIQAYKTVLQSILVQELIRNVRSWYNAKIKAINSCTTAEELSLISFDDCPDIS